MKRARTWARYLAALLALAVLTLISGHPALLAFLILMVLLPIFCWLFQWFFLRKQLQPSLKLPVSAQKGREIELRLRLSGHTLSFPAACLVRVENLLTGEVSRLFLRPSRLPERKAALKSNHCGGLWVQCEGLWLTDWFGVAYCPVPHDASARLTVYPDTFPMELCARPASAPFLDGEEYDAAAGRDRSEPFALRDYRPGDDLRQIHWKLSGKLGKPVVKEGSEPVDRSVLVVFDRACTLSPESSDALAEVAISLAHALCEQGISFTLCCRGDRCDQFHIENSQQLLTAVPALLQTSLTGRPTALPELSAFGRVLVCAASLAPEVEAALGRGRVRVLLCGDAADSEHITGFTPENFRKTLSFLEFS